MSKHEEAPHERHAQRLLAQEVTRLIHGNEALAAVEQVSAVVFGGGQELTAEAATMLSQEVPSLTLSKSEAADRLGDLAGLLVELNLAKSKSEARDFITAGAIKVGLTAEKIQPDTSAEQILELQDNNLILIRRGKNNLGVIALTS